MKKLKIFSRLRRKNLYLKKEDIIYSSLDFLFHDALRELKCARYSIWHQIILSPQMTFCSGLDIISIYFLEIIIFIQKCWRSCNAWEQEYTLSIFWKFLKRVPAEKIFIEFKVYKSESQAIQTKVITILQHFSRILFRKNFLQPKKRLISHLQHLLAVNRNNYLVSWLMQLFTGFEWKVFRSPVEIIFNLSPSSI